MIPVDIAILLLIGGAAGYFLTILTQFIVFVVGILYLWKKESKDDSGLVSLFWFGAIVVGMIIGDLVRVIPQLHIYFSSNLLLIIKSWFVR